LGFSGGIGAPLSKAIQNPTFKNNTILTFTQSSYLIDLYSNSKK